MDFLLGIRLISFFVEFFWFCSCRGTLGSTCKMFVGVFFVCFWLSVVGGKRYGWKRGLINFRFIAEIDRLRISHHQLHVFVAPITVFALFMFALYLLAARGSFASAMPPRWFAFILYVSCLAILVSMFFSVSFDVVFFFDASKTKVVSV
jgi:hypothetical protein